MGACLVNCFQPLSLPAAAAHLQGMVVILIGFTVARIDGDDFIGM
jgi:hypothetical protein